MGDSGYRSRVHIARFSSELIAFALEDAGLEAGGIAGRNAARRALVQARSKESEFSRTPRDCMQHNPTLVGEVAYTNKSFQDLKRELTH